MKKSTFCWLAVLGAVLFIGGLLGFILFQVKGAGTLPAILSFFAMLAGLFILLFLFCSGKDIPCCCCKKAAAAGAAGAAAAAVAAAAPKAEAEAEEPKAAPAPKAEAKPAAEPAAEKRDRWIVKAYADLKGEDLLNAPVNALWGVSEGDAELLKNAFNIKTIKDLATNKFFAWAEEIVAEAAEK